MILLRTGDMEVSGCCCEALPPLRKEKFERAIENSEVQLDCDCENWLPDINLSTGSGRPGEYSELSGALLKGR